MFGPVPEQVFQVRALFSFGPQVLGHRSYRERQDKWACRMERAALTLEVSASWLARAWVFCVVAVLLFVSETVI